MTWTQVYGGEDGDDGTRPAVGLSDGTSTAAATGASQATASGSSNGT